MEGEENQTEGQNEEETQASAGAETQAEPDAAPEAAKVPDSTAIRVVDQNGDHLATVDVGDSEHVHVTMGGQLFRFTHAVAEELRKALAVITGKEPG